MTNPQLEAASKDRLVTLLFQGTVAPNTVLTLVSKRLPFFFKTRRFSLSFALNTNRTVECTYYLSFDPTAPATGIPTGTPIFAQLGSIIFIVGDDETITVNHQTIAFQAGSYIKLHLSNSDGFAHTIFGYAEIQIIGRPNAQTTPNPDNRPPTRGAS